MSSHRISSDSDDGRASTDLDDPCCEAEEGGEWGIAGGRLDGWGKNLTPKFGGKISRSAYLKSLGPYEQA